MAVHVSLRLESNGKFLMTVFSSIDELFMIRAAGGENWMIKATTKARFTDAEMKFM
jgi:hypothetical protein